MATRATLIVLLLLSLTANATIGYRLLRGPRVGDSPRSTSGSGPASAATLPGTVADNATAAPSNPGAVKGASVAASTTGRDWDRIAARNPAVLMQRMRAAGFSVEATRGAVYALLRELQNEERARIMAMVPPEPFWKNATRNPAQLEQSREITRLWNERDRLMRELFPEEQTAHLLRLRARFGPLPDDKLSQLAMLEEDYEELRRQVQQQSPLASRMPWTAEQLALLEQERERDLAALLSPAELEDFNLRASRTARILQNNLETFAPTEAEYREIFRQRSAFEKKLPLAGDTTPAAMAARQAAQKEMDAALKAALGPDRFAEYERSMDFNFHSAYRITQRLGLDVAAANATYELQRSTEQRLNAIRSGRAQVLGDALAALRADVRAKLDQLLTPAGSEEYQRSAFWLRQLDPPRPAPPR